MKNKQRTHEKSARFKTNGRGGNVSAAAALSLLHLFGEYARLA